MRPYLAQLFRHPIKAHGVEALDATKIVKGQTLPWDRRWAVPHEHAKTDGSMWAPCVNFSRGAKVSTLMAIAAKTDETRNVLRLDHPDLSPIEFDPIKEGDRFLKWVAPLMPTDRAASTGLVEVDAGRGMTDTDFPSISLASMSSLKAISEKAGATLDPRRFRANMWIDGAPPWEEFQWVGQRIAIGDIAFRVEERITRCRATMANPETGQIDVDTLSVLRQGWDHQDFGVYLVAEGSGEIALGAELDVLP